MFVSCSYGGWETQIVGQGRVSGELRGPHMVGKAEGKGSVKSLFYSCGKNPMNQAPPKPLSLDIIALGLPFSKNFGRDTNN